MGSQPDGTYVCSHSGCYSKIIRIIVRIGAYNTWFAHVLPIIAMPVSLFLVKQFVDGIPNALIEAAVVDGEVDVTILRKVIVPLTKPALATSVGTLPPAGME